MIEALARSLLAQISRHRCTESSCMANVCKDRSLTEAKKNLADQSVDVRIFLKYLVERQRCQKYNRLD
jgi:hypothetical protein